MNKQRKEIYSFRNVYSPRYRYAPLAIEILESVCQIGAEKFFKNRSEEGVGGIQKVIGNGF